MAQTTQPGQIHWIAGARLRLDELGRTALGGRQGESLHALRRDLGHLLGHLQTAMFDVLPRWQERFRDAIVVSRRAQTSRFGRSLTRSLDRDEVARELLRTDATRRLGPDESDEEELPEAPGPVALHAVPTADSVPGPTRMAPKLAKVGIRLACARRQLGCLMASARRRLFGGRGGSSLLGSSGFSWS